MSSAAERPVRTGDALAAVLLHTAFAVAVGVVVGCVAAGFEAARNDYLEHGLNALSWSLFARATLRASTGALLVVGGTRLLEVAATRFGPRALAAPVAWLGIFALCWVAARYGIDDVLWIAPWEPWAAATLVALVTLLPRWNTTRGRSAAWACVVLATLAAPSVVSAVLDAQNRAELARSARPNVLLLLVDALRADHVGAYGYERPTTPTIDALARRGVRFAEAVSPSNKTRTTMPSLWSGLYPSRHGVFGVTDLVPRRLVTAAELLRDAGYRTGAWCPNPNLDRSVGHVQGWDRYDDRALQPDRRRGPKWAQFETASRIDERFLAWLDRDPHAPFLAWLHYRDVHGPYVPPPPYDTMFDSAEARPLSPEEAARRKKYLNLPDDGNDLRTYVDRYDGEIRYTDDRIAELLGALEERGLLDRTVIVVVADHGETFLDHGFWDHGDTLHQEQVHVPLVVVGPGIAPGVVGEPVSTLDLFATLLELAGVAPPANDGTSLWPFLAGRSEVRREGPILSEAETPQGVRQFAVRRGPWKLVGDVAGKTMLHDLRRDPGEVVDLSRDQQDVAARLREEWESFWAVPSVAGRERAPAEPDAEMRRQLEALGYVDG